MHHKPMLTFSTLEEAIQSLSLPDLCHFWMELTGTSEQELVDQILALMENLNPDEIDEMMEGQRITIERDET